MMMLKAINKILQDKDIEWLKTRNYYEDTSLWGAYEDYYKFIKEHYDKYGQIMDVSTFLDKFESWTLETVTESTESILDRLDEEIYYGILAPALNNLGADTSDSFKMHDLLVSTVDELTEKRKKIAVDKIGTDIRDIDIFAESDDDYITTGFREIDTYIEGFCGKGSLTGIMARTNAGKTWTLLKMAVAAFVSGKNICYIMPEMTKKKLTQRIATLALHLRNSDFKTGKFGDSERRLFKDFFEKHENTFVLLDKDDIEMTTTDIEHYINLNRPNILYIDGIAYIKPKKQGKEPTYEVLEQTAKELYAISYKYQVPIVFVMQTNRQAARKETMSKLPVFDDMAGSYNIATVCDTFFSIAKDEDTFKILLLKSRDEATGIIWIYHWIFDGGVCDFLDKQTLNDEIKEESEKTEEPKKSSMRREMKGQPLIRTDKQVDENGIPF